MSMSMSRPMTASAVRVAPQLEQHEQQQQENYQIQRQPQEQEQEQEQQSDHVSYQRQSSQRHQFACLYTHQKTKKRKTWQDGKFVLQSHGHGMLYDANPPPGSGNPVLVEVELSRTEVDSVLQRQQTLVESERYLIQLEGIWVEPTRQMQPSSGQGPMVSNGMQKLLSKKFQKPRRYIPPNPAQSQSNNNNNPLAKRRRPVQPGELVKQHYGGHAGHTVQQQQPPLNQIQAPGTNSAMSAWGAPANPAPITIPDRPNGFRYAQRQPSAPTGGAPFQQPPLDNHGSNNAQWNNSMNSCPQPTRQPASFAGRSSQPEPFQKSNPTQEDAFRLQNTDQNENQRPGAAFQVAGQQHQRQHQSDPFQASTHQAQEAPQANGFQQVGNSQQHAAVAQSHNRHDQQQSQGFPPARRSAAQQQFIRNSFDPGQFYGVEDDDEEDDEEDDQPFPMGGWLPAAANQNNQNSASHSDGAGCPHRITPTDGLGSDGAASPNDDPAISSRDERPSSCPSFKASTTISDEKESNATMTNDDLLDLFGGGAAFQSQVHEDDDRHGHDGPTRNETDILTNNTVCGTDIGSDNLVQPPVSSSKGVAISEQPQGGAPSAQQDAEEFVLPPAEESSSDESSDDEN